MQSPHSLIRHSVPSWKNFVLADLVGENTEDALMEGHYGMIAAPVGVDDVVGENPHDEVVPQLGGLFQESQMADVEEVEGTADVNNL